MHISHSEQAVLNPEVQVGESRCSPDGQAVFGPDVQVWPLGQSSPAAMAHYWTFTVTEAEQLALALYSAVQRARELFPTD